MDPPATKIVVFEIEGDTEKEEFTHGLAIQLSRYMQVVHGDDLLTEGDEVDESDFPALCRQVGAQAFVVGELTVDEKVDATEWVIRGFFELHDVENDMHVGGVPDAEGIWGVALQTRKKAEARALKFRQKLAKHVAKELSKGLGVPNPLRQK